MGKTPTIFGREMSLNEEKQQWELDGVTIMSSLDNSRWFWKVVVETADLHGICISMGGACAETEAAITRIREAAARPGT